MMGDIKMRARDETDYRNIIKPRFWKYFPKLLNRVALERRENCIAREAAAPATA
jgi:hypothetical protein